MSIYVSKARREELMKLMNTSNDELEVWLRDIRSELKAYKYGSVFEEHVKK